MRPFQVGVIKNRRENTESVVVQESSEASSESLQRFSYPFVDIPVLNLAAWLKTVFVLTGEKIHHGLILLRIRSW